MKNKQSKANPKIFGCFGIGIAFLGFLICFIPFIGAYGMGLGFFGIIFSGITYHLLQKENKSLTMPIIGLALGITSVCFGGYQFYQYKPAFDTISHIKKKKDEGLFRLVKHFFFKKDEGIEKTMDEVFPDRHDLYLLSIVDKLRVRSEPNLESEIVGHLDFGDKALFLNEESTHKDSIEIAGAIRYSNWKKVKFSNPSVEKEIVGWAYGGALISPSKSKIQSTEEKYFKTIYKNSKIEVSKLIGLDIEEAYTFHGIVSYKRPQLEPFTKEGDFRIIGYAKKRATDLHDFQNKVVYHGHFKDGNLDGLLTYSHFGYKMTSVIKIKYENGICTWASINRNGKWGKDFHEKTSPENCGFQYIRGWIEDDI